MSAVEKFPILLSEAEEESSAVPPCFTHEGVNASLLSWCVLHNGLTLVRSTSISGIQTYTCWR